MEKIWKHNAKDATLSLWDGLGWRRLEMQERECSKENGGRCDRGGVHLLVVGSCYFLFHISIFQQFIWRSRPFNISTGLTNLPLFQHLLASSLFASFLLSSFKLAITCSSPLRIICASKIFSCHFSSFLCYPFSTTQVASHQFPHF